MTPRILRAAVIAAVLAAGCNDSTTTATGPTIVVTPILPVTTTLSSRLAAKGSVSRGFTTSRMGTVTAALTSAGPAGTQVGFGIGVPAGTGTGILPGIATCTLSQSILTTASDSPQLIATVDAGQYCVVVFDPGTLPDAINFDLTIVYP